jgi:hypothetical protein
MKDKLNTSDWTKEKKEAYEQAISKLELEKELQKEIEEILKNNAQE